MYALLGRTQDFREGDKGTFRDTGRQGQSPVESSEDRPLPSGKCQLIFHFFLEFRRFGQTHRKDVTPSLDLTQLYLNDSDFWNYLSKFMQ